MLKCASQHKVSPVTQIRRFNLSTNLEFFSKKCRNFYHNFYNFIAQPYIFTLTMTHVAATILQELYTIKMLEEKNILFIQIRGAWKSHNLQMLNQYLADIDNTIEQIKPGFFVLVDIRYMKPVCAEVSQFHILVQKKLMQKGLIAGAEITRPNQLLYQNTEYCATQSGIFKRTFTKFEEAYEWFKYIQQKYNHKLTKLDIKSK